MSQWHPYVRLFAPDGDDNSRREPGRQGGKRRCDKKWADKLCTYQTDVDANKHTLVEWERVPRVSSRTLQLVGELRDINDTFYIRWVSWNVVSFHVRIR